jgi:surface antigen
MTERLAPATLQAFVEGQLAPDVMTEIAARLAEDPEALREVRALQADRALLQAAYRDVAEAPLPDKLLATIDRGFARRRQRHGVAKIGYAMAAAIAMVVVGGLAGYLAGEYRLQGELAAIAARQAEDQRVLAAAIDQALERAASGESIEWQNPDSGAHGQIIPVRTYRSKSNHWCREYLASKVTADVEEKSRAIACREGNGDWVKVEERYYES